jgi:hypothetical protein
MNFFIRASNGWEIARRSFKLLEANKQLLFFPLFSGIALSLIILPVFFIFFQQSIWSNEKQIPALYYLYAFGFYLVNYFIIVFFNTALTHCVRCYFNGEGISIKKGIVFSCKHIGIIFTWAFFAATIGTILRIVLDNAGVVGRIIAGILNSLCGLATYFVLPVIVFEKLGPLAAFRRSVELLKNKWGQTVGAAFNFIFIQFIATVFIAIIALTIGTVFSIMAGAMLAIFGVLMLVVVISAARIIFITTVYQNLNGLPVEHFDKAFLDNLFIMR